MAESLDESLIKFEQCGYSNIVTPILNLPNEVLDHIFSYLSIKDRIRTESVCRSWAEFGKNCKWSWPKKLSPKLVTNKLFRNDDDVWSSVLSRCGSSLKKIEINLNHPFYGPTCRTCHVIGTKCPNLATIEFCIFDAVKDSEALLSITKGCGKLKKISIKIDPSCTSDTANMCLALKECRSLEYIELRFCTIELVEGCLDTIVVPLKGSMLEIIVTESYALVAEKLFRRKDPIEQLELTLVCNEPFDWPVEIVNNYNNTVRELNLPSCHTSASNWCKMMVTMNHLEVLSLWRASFIEDKLMRVLADNCKKLKKLDISESGVTDLGVSYLTALPKLTVLYLNGNENIRGEGILNLATCGHLEELYFGYIEHQGNLIEQACMGLATSCPNLHLLDLRYNVNITNKLVDEFRASIQRGFLKGVVTLVITGNQMNLVDLEDCANLKLVS